MQSFLYSVKQACRLPTSEMYSEHNTHLELLAFICVAAMARFEFALDSNVLTPSVSVTGKMVSPETMMESLPLPCLMSSFELAESSHKRSRIFSL